MNTYEYDMRISAPTEKEADTKMAALKILAAKLKANELARLAEVVEKEPVKTALAKQALGL